MVGGGGGFKRTPSGSATNFLTVMIYIRTDHFQPYLLTIMISDYSPIVVKKLIYENDIFIQLTY